MRPIALRLQQNSQSVEDVGLIVGDQDQGLGPGARHGLFAASWKPLGTNEQGASYQTDRLIWRTDEVSGNEHREVNSIYFSSRAPLDQFPEFMFDSLFRHLNEIARD